MSDTKPHQDAVDAIDEYRDIIQWAELRTDMTEQDCRELVGMVKREARAFADAELRAALAPLYRDGDTVMLDTQSIHDKIWCFVAERMNELSAAQHQQIVAQVKELLDLAARVYNAESLVRYRDIEIDSLKATVNDLQLIITSMKS